MRSDTLVVIRKCSRTCCGFLGGDCILFLDTVRDLLAAFREKEAHLPYPERQGHGVDTGPEIRGRTGDTVSERYRSLFHAFQVLPGSEALSRIPGIIPFIAGIPDQLWFAPERDLFRYSLTPVATVASFISSDFYQVRLVACLKWWYLNEAGLSDREEYPGLLSMERLSFPLDENLIQKAVDLYNNGTYELTGW